jgi:CDP-4-dehydro-6-deoxyglucose reductase
VSHTVTLHPGGQRFSAHDRENLLDAALRHGLTLPFGCRNGSCRSCRARLREGRVSEPLGPSLALSALERERGYLLLCRSRAAGDLQLEAEELDRNGRIQVRSVPVRVAGMQRLAHDVMGLSLTLPAGERLPFLAGQYLDVVLRDGRRRAFSIASPPSRSDCLDLHIRHVPGGRFSGQVFHNLRERALLRVSGPLGDFHVRDLDADAVLIAGGTGFAPMKSIIEDAIERRFGGHVHLYWGVRARKDLYLHELVRSWAAAHPRLRYVPVLSQPDAADDWQGRTGPVHEAAMADWPRLAGAHVYLSGPPPMVAAARAGAEARGVDPANIHSDAFDFAHETGHDG